MKLSDYLVVSDIDGTLLVQKQGIPAKNVSAIERFCERGGNFTLCTGRGVEAVSHLIDDFRISAPAIMCNGGICFDYSKKEIVFETVLDVDAKDVVTDIMKEFPNVGVELVLPDRVAVPKMSELVNNHVSSFHMAYELCDLQDAELGWNKILFAEEPEVVDQMIEYIKKKCESDEVSMRYDFVRTSPTFYECVPKGINKGDAMLKLAGILGVKPEHTIAIGDYYNDLPLLEKAATAVVVAGAPDEIKKLADVVVSNCMDGGVGEYLEMLMEEHPE